MVEGFKSSDVGLIPKDWSVKKIGDCLLRNPDYGINAAAVPFNENLPVYLRITDISEEGNYSKKNIVSVNNVSSSSYYLQDGDLVFARTGASVGKTYLYTRKDGKLVFAGFLIRVRTNEEILLPNYLKYFTQTKQYWDWIASNSMRTGQPGINGNEYKELYLALPPTTTEQSSIANALFDADALIQQLEQLLAKKRNIKTGVMQELLKPKKGWEEVCLNDCLELLTDFEANGSFESVAKNVFITDKEDFAWYVRATDLENNTELTKVKYVDAKSYMFLAKTKLFGGEVLITKRGEIGKVYYFEKKTDFATVAPNMYLLKLNNKVVPYFIYVFFKSVGNKLLIEKNASTTLGALYKNDVKSITFSIPTKEEQTKITQILSDIDREIEEIEMKIAKYNNIKQGMMQSLLTGKIRLV